MLYSYLLVALRAARRHLGYAALSVGGLALGLGACLLAYALVVHETSFDAHHPDAERTYRVNTHFQDFVNGPSLQAQAPTGLVAQLQQHGVPGVERLAPVQRTVGVRSVKADGRFFEQRDVGFVDPAFFETFAYPRRAGSPRAFGAPGTAVITEDTARRYFGRPEAAVGQRVRLDGQHALEVVAVVADPPATTHLAFEFFASYATQARARASWFDDQSFTDGHSVFVVLGEAARPEAVAARLNALRPTFQGAQAQGNTDFRLQPVTSIHTTPSVSSWDGRYQTAPAQLWTLGGVGAAVALLAAINFVSLATAQASQRAREVGVRKAVGATRAQLAAQFLGETLLLATVAGLVGGLAAYGALPLAGRVFGVELARDALLTPQALLFAAGATLATGLLAGTYPALLIARYPPASVLKGDGGRLQGRRLREGLTISQLVVAQVLLVGTLAGAWQMRYLQAKDLGYEQEARLSVNAPRDSVGRARFRAALRQAPAVRGVTYAMYGPTQGGLLDRDLVAAHAPADTLRSVRMAPADAHYLGVYGIDLVAGRGLTEADERAPRSRVAVVNRAMAERMGFAAPAQALGTTVSGEGARGDDFQVEVVGVTENFHHSSLRTRIGPVMMLYEPKWHDMAGVALDPARVGDGLAQATAAFRTAFPDTHFRYQFLDRQLAGLYDDERRVTRLTTFFAGLAVAIACLGLFGLAAFAAERRRKEIGVRKVLGATVASVVALLSKDVARLVGVAFALATPVAYLAVRPWLNGFAYRIDLSPALFLGAGAVALALALAATSTQALRAALIDPARVLRSE